jgi:hypothetical protein
MNSKTKIQDNSKSNCKRNSKPEDDIFDSDRLKSITVKQRLFPKIKK